MYEDPDEAFSNYTTIEKCEGFAYFREIPYFIYVKENNEHSASCEFFTEAAHTCDFTAGPLKPKFDECECPCN